MLERIPKILAYFGSDFGLRNGAKFLKNAHRQGYGLLALDSHAMALASRAGVPYSLLDDWLEPETIVRAIDLAQECGSRWYESARQEFTVDEICLPQVDRCSMDKFWQDAMLALELAHKIKGSDCNEFRYFTNPFPRAGVALNGSDICGRLWRAELGTRFKSLLRFGTFGPGEVLSIVRKAAIRLAGPVFNKQATTPVQPHAFPDKAIALLMKSEEVFRLQHVVKTLMTDFPDGISIVLGSHKSGSSDNVYESWGIPVYYGERWPAASYVSALPLNLMPRIDKDLEEKFFHGYRVALEKSGGQPWQKTLEVLKFHFNYYCRYRWPALYKHNFLFWRGLWERMRPSVLLITGMPEGVMVLASEAARQCDIPILVLPHACGAIRVNWEGLTMGCTLYNSRMQKTNFVETNIRSESLRPCRDLVAKNEYPVQAVKAFSGNGKCQLLALTETTVEGPHLNAYTSPSAQLKALLTLVNPPPDLIDKVDVAVKVHPQISDLEMIEAAGSAVMEKLLPRASELEPALNETDLVVAVNYRGGALVHVLKMAKPVIYFLTEKEAMLKRSDYPYDTFLGGMAVARTAEEFWSLVRKFIDDPRFAADLRSKAADFARENLDDDTYPALPQILKELLRV